VGGQISGVLRKISPDRERVAEICVHNSGRERLKDDRSVVTDARESPKKSVKVDGSGSQVSTVAFPDVHVSELVPRVENGAELRAWRSREDPVPHDPQ